jgi:hypothetical protein
MEASQMETTQKCTSNLHQLHPQLKCKTTPYTRKHKNFQLLLLYLNSARNQALFLEYVVKNYLELTSTPVVRNYTISLLLQSLA